MTIQQPITLPNATRPASSLSGAIAFGRSVRMRKAQLPDYPAPSTAYLLYITMNDMFALAVRTLRKDFEAGETIDSVEDLLFAEGRATVANGTASEFEISRNFDMIPFDKSGYFTIVVDNQNWSFYYPRPDDTDPPGALVHDPIVFIGEKVTYTDAGNLVKSTYEQNTSFFDCAPRVIGGMQAIRCVNYVRDANGAPLAKGAVQNLAFNIYLQVPISIENETRNITIIIDPDGQNQGPPSP